MSSVDTATSAPRELRVIDWGRFALIGVATVIAAVIATALVYFIGSAFVAYDSQFVVLSNVSPTIIFTVVPASVAVVLYALLLRFTANPARIFTIAAAVVLLVSLIPDLTYIPTVPGATGAQTAVLMVMHIVAAIVIVTMLTTLTRPQSR